MTMRTDHLRSLGLAIAASALVGCATTAGSYTPMPLGSGSASTTLRDAQGATVGTATLTESNVGLLIRGSVNGLPAGAHAIHVHTVGQCSPPFASAGGHYNPTGRQHGFMNPQGHHAGDLPNINVPPSGSLDFELTLTGVTLAGSPALLDADGASLVIHASADDHATDPAGNSGDRIACGVIAAR